MENVYDKCKRWLDNSSPLASAHGSVHEPQSRNRSAIDDSIPRPHKRAAHRMKEEQRSEPSAESSSQASSSKRSRSSRNTSPGKTATRLLRQHTPIKSATFEAEDSSRLPQPISDLISRISRFADGLATAPLSLMKSWSDVSMTYEHVFYHPDHDRAKLGRDPTAEEVEMIAEQARGCQARQDDEAGWNSNVHGPLLVLARALSRHRQGINVVNTTLARPMERFRPHTVGLSGKMVDFGLVLDTTSALWTAFPTLQCEADNTAYFNHTPFDPIAMQPLAVSIETKRNGGDEMGGLQQLKIWASAHLMRLAELRCQPLTQSETVCLPLLLVIGPTWYFYLARGEYGVTGQLKEIVVHASIEIGNTTRAAGTLRVLSVLLDLMDWCQTMYRPWFEALVTPSSPPAT